MRLKPLSRASGNYSSVRQSWGYNIEDAIQDFYEEDHPGKRPILRSKKVFRKDDPWRWLFPDIFDPNTGLWLEVKPLSISGVSKGEAKRRLNLSALPGQPDLFWISPLIVSLATGDRFITVNVAGIVYYADENDVRDGLLELVADGAAISARELVKYIGKKAAAEIIGEGLRPVLGRISELAISGRQADSARLQQSIYVIPLLGL